MRQPDIRSQQARIVRAYRMKYSDPNDPGRMLALRPSADEFNRVMDAVRLDHITYETVRVWSADTGGKPSDDTLLLIVGTAPKRLWPTVMFSDMLATRRPAEFTLSDFARTALDGEREGATA